MTMTMTMIMIMIMIQQSQVWNAEFPFKIKKNLPLVHYPKLRDISSQRGFD